ncbi:MAG: hypothetical protein K5770_19520 [Lachnospiraceae bacterium]|nr:hypothetical protein [Lachnospiraceae bacterium]
MTGKKELVSGKGTIVGDDVIVTKWIGLEGTFIIAGKREQELNRHFNPSFIRGVKGFAELLPTFNDTGAVSGSEMHFIREVSECGIFGALWEMAEALKSGLNIEIKSIPIRQETIEICEYYRINPYWLLSGGSLLIAAPDGYGIVSKLIAKGLNAAVIGKITAGNDRLLLNGEGRRYLEPPKGDEINKVVGILQREAENNL